MTDDAKLEEQIQSIREKRTAETIILNDYLSDKRRLGRNMEALNKKIKMQVDKIRNYSFSIGQLKGENGNSGKVTDHAIVRYLERYKGVDVESIINEILEHPDAKLSDKGVITTVYKDEQPVTNDARQLVRMAKLRKAI